MPIGNSDFYQLKYVVNCPARVQIILATTTTATMRERPDPCRIPSPALDTLMRVWGPMAASN